MQLSKGGKRGFRSLPASESMPFHLLQISPFHTFGIANSLEFEVGITVVAFDTIGDMPPFIVSFVFDTLTYPLSFRVSWRPLLRRRCFSAQVSILKGSVVPIGDCCGRKLVTVHKAPSVVALGTRDCQAPFR
jgi:hypothetical protein